MNEKQFQEIVNYLDDAILKPFLDYVVQKSSKRYNELIIEGLSPDDAMHTVVCETAYVTLKYATAFTLFMNSDYDPDKPKSKEELKKMLKLIKN